MDNTYTDDRSYLLQPTHTLLILIGITAVVSTLLNILGRELFDGSLWVYIPAVLMSVLLFSLGYVAAHTMLPQETVTLEETPAEDRATTEETDELFYKISTVLREDKLFADSLLTIQDLANAVGSNRTYVSNCINRRTGLSFSQYIARYRVEHAQTILVDAQYTDDHEAIAAAITLSGFTSNQTFYRLFKEITGITPLQFRHKNLK
jgi:AraC-like DNA-binding protein